MSRLRSPWPMILASLFMFMVAGGPLIGYAVLYLLPMLLVCTAAFYAVSALYRSLLCGVRPVPGEPGKGA